MAALAATTKTARIPVGDRVMQTYRLAAIGTAAADEYIVTGLKWIDCVVGDAPSSTAGWLTAPVYMINAQGTGQTEGDHPGDLGVEVLTAGDNDLTVTVIGIP